MKKTVGIVGFVLAIVFLILGFCSATPDKYIKSYGDGRMHEYVGGDAYNYIIEASLRGGEIAGAKTAKAIYFCAAGILAVLSLSFITADEEKKGIRNAVSSLRHDVESGFEKTTDAIADINQSFKSGNEPQAREAETSDTDPE